MEDDSLVVRYPNAVLYMVMDGHGGRDVVDYAKATFPTLFNDVLREPPSLLIQAIKDAFLRLDEDIYQRRLVSGTTVVAVLHLLKESTLYFINVGDSRAVLAEGGNVIFETEDHKPHMEEERIAAAGGSVDHGRVNGMLAVSRALGDNDFKVRVVAEKRQWSTYAGFRAMVSPEPDITLFQMQEDHKGRNYTLILASDGLWDGVSSKEAAAFAPNECQSLLDKGKNNAGRNCDNITVMMARVNGPLTHVNGPTTHVAPSRSRFRLSHHAQSTDVVPIVIIVVVAVVLVGLWLAIRGKPRGVSPAVQ